MRIIQTKLPDTIPANEECDACPAFAKLMVLVGDKNRIPIGPLSFCSHHGGQNEPALFANTSILDVVDERAEWGAKINRDMLGHGTYLLD